MSTRMQVAAKVAREKEANPDRFCRIKGCLWRVRHADGRETPCRKHASYAREAKLIEEGGPR